MKFVDKAHKIVNIYLIFTYNIENYGFMVTSRHNLNDFNNIAGEPPLARCIYFTNDSAPYQFKSKSCHFVLNRKFCFKNYLDSFGKFFSSCKYKLISLVITFYC